MGFVKNLRMAAIIATAALGSTPSLAAIQDAYGAEAPIPREAIGTIDPSPAESTTIDQDAGSAILAQASDAGAAEPARRATIRMIAEPIVQDISAQLQAEAANPTGGAFTVNSILDIPAGPFRYGDWYWDESAAPEKGKLIVTVDLEARVASVFRGGHEIGTAVALLGTKKHPTPLGTFPILTKEKDNISEKYDNAPMPWTLRLTWDGIAIHGSPVINGYASHGCIGVPNEFAEKLFSKARRGDLVIITRGKTIGIGDPIS